MPAAVSTAWQKAVPCEKAESPETLSARNTPLATGSCSKSFSVPLCV